MSNYSILEYLRVEHAVAARDVERLARIRSDVEKFVRESGTVFLYDRSQHAHGELHFPIVKFSSQKEIDEAFGEWEEATASE